LVGGGVVGGGLVKTRQTCVLDLHVVMLLLFYCYLCFSVVRCNT